MKTPRMSRWTVAALGACALALASCASLKGQGVAAGPDGGIYAVTVGTPLVVGLPNDPGTDYRWELLPTIGPQLWLIGGPDYTLEPKPEVMLGLPGTTTFRFRAREVGTTTLEFGYRRPSETSVAPIKVARFDVTVTPFTWRDAF